MDSDRTHRTMLAQNLSTADNSHPNVKISVVLNLSPTTQTENVHLWAQEHHAPCLPSVSWQSCGLLCSPKERTHVCRDFPETEMPLNVHHAFSSSVDATAVNLFLRRRLKWLTSYSNRGTLWDVCQVLPGKESILAFFIGSAFHNPRTNAELKRPKRRKKLATVFTLKVG